VLNTKRSFPESCALVQIAAGVEDIIIVEPVGRPVKMVRTTFCDHIDYRPGGMAVFGGKLIGNEPNLLHHLRAIHPLLAPGGKGSVRILPVNDEVITARPDTIHREVRASWDRGVAVIELADAGRGKGKRENIAESTLATWQSRQIAQPLLIKSQAYFGRGGV